jgi:hypothetical protein
MSHTIYVAKFEQTIIHQHVHLRRESQVTFTSACANEIIPAINRSFVYKVKKGRHVSIANIIFRYLFETDTLLFNKVLISSEKLFER